MKTLKTAILISLLSVSFNSFADLNNGLVAYWSFDDCTARDNSSNALNGSIIGNPVCVNGTKGKALEFNSNDLIERLYSNIPSDNFSVSMWIKATDINSGVFSVNAGSFNASNGHDRHIYLSSGKLCQRVWSAGVSYDHNSSDTNNDGNVNYISCTTTSLNSGFNHIVYTVSSNSISLYINSVLANKIDGKPSEFYWSDRFLLGYSLDGANYYFNGILDEFRYYNRPLTDSEITVLYQQVAKTIKNGVSSNTDQCINNANWCTHPTFTVFGVTKDSDIPINLINTSYIVDGFNRNISSGKVNITANLYNRGYADAMLDIYDKQGNWTGFIVLNGNRPETSIIGDIWDKWTTTYDSYNDPYSTFDPRDAGSSKKLSVNFVIPKDGYAVLSKNSTSAIANTLLNNTLAIFGEQEWIEQNGKAKVKLLKIFANKIITEGLNTLVDKLRNAVEINNQEEANNITLEMTGKLSLIAYDIFVNDSETVIKAVGGKKAKSFAKKANKYFSPLGELIGAAETVATGLSITGQWIDIAKANNNRAVYFK